MITDLRKSYKARDFIAFLNKIDREVPNELDVHVIFDSLATHKTRGARVAAAPSSVPLPLHPDLRVGDEPGERWFSALTTKKLQRSAHRSVKGIAADIRTWVETWNGNPKPFTWHKPAEEILDRLAAQTWTISGPDHLDAVCFDWTSCAGTFGT